MYENVIVIRSKTEDDAVVRLQSDAVLRGIRQTSALSASVIRVGSDRAVETVPANACLLFHYDDASAISFVRSLAKAEVYRAVACFANDMYSFDEYLAVHDIVDFYLAPTRLHKLVLQGQLYKPVYLLHESIDPTSIKCEPDTFPEKTGRRILWFGYPESFEKGMASLVPVLKQHEANETIDSFTLIVGMQGFENRFDMTTMPYRKDTFAVDATPFDYCILSHLPLDLTLNSYIKSPNKLVTALMLGLIPIASRTPAYEDLLTQFGLERFLFDSPLSLDKKLASLDPAADSLAVRNSGILQALRESYSDISVGKAFLEILSNGDWREAGLRFKPRPELMKRGTPELHVFQHLRDLLPSIAREIRARVRR